MAFLGREATKSPLTSSDLPDNAVTLAKMTGGTDGNIISYDASGDPVAIATGTDGQVLTSTGAGSPPAFEAFPAGHVLKTEYSQTMSTDWDQDSSGYIGDSIPSERMLHEDTITITSGNYVLVNVLANVVVSSKGSTENYAQWGLSGAAGTGIATTSGKNLFYDYLYPTNWRFTLAGQFLDTSPGSTTPVYGLYILSWSTTSGNHRYGNNGTYITLQEIKS